MEGIREFRENLSNQPTETINVTEEQLLPYKQLFMKVAGNAVRGGFVVDDSNRQIVSALFLYFLGLPGPLDFRKGLWLEGPVGTGKSTLMIVFAAFMQYLERGFKVYICSDVTNEYSLTGNLDLYLSNRYGIIKGPAEMCFDELGREPVPAGYYGNKMNVLQHILHIRYNYWRTQGVRTFVTTNMDAERVGQFYGLYIRDRRKEMFNVVPLLGASRR